MFCNCDDPEESHFFRYFAMNFDHLGLKKLIATHYDSEKPTYKLEIDRKLDLNEDDKLDFHDIMRTPLTWNGDFRSPECRELLEQSDIVCTNPPFSLFRDYVAQLMEYNKKFVILWNMNALSYKEIFKLIKENLIWAWTWFNMSLVFRSPYENQLEANVKFCEQKWYSWRNYIKTPAINWFTNLDYKQRHEDLTLYTKYNEIEYPKYDNYDAINVDKVKDIPLDYPWLMGVPITFLGNYNPEQFEIIDGLNRYSILDWPTEETKGKYLAQVNGKPIYIRIIIRNKKPIS